MGGNRFARAFARLIAVAAVAGVIGVLLLTPYVPLAVVAADTLDRTQDDLFDRPPLPDDLPLAPQHSTVRSADEDVIAELSGPVRREPAPLDEVPQELIDAVVATEDSEFYEHGGVHHQSLARATARNLAAGEIEEGASTITQQYVRMALLDPEQTIDRKVHEIMLAVELEERLDKDEILERYLNTVYLGRDAYGVGTAAEHYFSTPLDELGLAEAALLAGTIRAPAATNPIDDPEAAAQRRDVVVRQMLGQGLIDEAEADDVIGTEVELDVRELEVGEPFWVDMVKRLVYDPRTDLQPGLQDAVGDSVDERVETLFEGGLEIHTTLDESLHDHAADTLASYLDDPVEDPLGSLISIEHATGAVRAIALGPREFGTCPEDEEGPCEQTQINPTIPGAGGSGRQSGSAFKPFVAAVAFEEGVDDDDLVYDAESGETIDGCGPSDESYEPENFGGSDYEDLDLDEAMGSSVNVFFTKLVTDLGIEAVADLAARHGLSHSPNLADFTDRMCSIALGAAEVFPLEMTVGYGTWANDGERCDPYVIDRVEDRDGEVIYEHEPECEQAVDEDVAEDMGDLLLEPVGPDGTASVVGDEFDEDAVGKTGTTDDVTDAWFVGSQGDHTTTAWVGFEQPEPMQGIEIGGSFYDQVTGGSLPASLWTDYVTAAEAE